MEAFAIGSLYLALRFNSMAKFLRLLASLAILATTVSAAPTLQARSPVVPSKDAFYNVPSGLEHVKPGTILRHRAPPVPIAAFRKHPIKLEYTQQILYRTSDSFGNATATVLTVLVPHNADFGKVLSYQVAEDAACLDCAASYVFQLDSETGPNQGTKTTQLEMLLIEAALEQGWVVIAPDHEGPKAAFLANGLAGRATLDGIRAAINSAEFTGISASPRVALWGYSGGSLASGFAAELQPTYAPELKIYGAALGGTVPNITSVMLTINKGPDVGLMPAGLLGMAKEFPEMAQAVNKYLKPEYKAAFEKTLSQCQGANSKQFENQDVVGMLKDGFISDPVVRRIVSLNEPGKATPRIPLYIYKSTADEISVVEDTDNLVDKYCADGASVQYIRDILSKHASLAVIGAFKALAWLRDVMDETELEKGCSRKTVLTSLLDLETTLEFVPKFIVDALLDLIGKPVGPA